MTSVIEEATKDPKKVYLPCADPNNDKGYGSLGTASALTSDENADDSKAFAPYKLVTTDSKNTFTDREGNSQVVDLGFEYHISCFDDEFGRGFGTKSIEGVTHTYIVDGAVGPEAENGNALIADIDSANNVKVWFTVGSADDSSYSDIAGTSIVGHIDVNDEVGLMQMTVTGNNTGPGCGMRFISNENYMLAHVDINDDYICSASEATANIKEAEGAVTWHSDKTDKYYCISVSGDQPQLAVLADCTGAGLTSDSFTIDRYHRSMVEGYHAPKLLLKKPVGANATKLIYLEQNNGGDSQ